MSKSGRSKGYRITASRRIQLGKTLRDLLALEPDLSIQELVIRTGCPYDMANFIRKRFKEEKAKAEAERVDGGLVELCHGMGQS